MAKMLPYPIEKFQDPTEERIYHLFEHELNEDYTVLYSRSWSQVSNGHNPDPECDFIILKPGAGIIVLEVKGGRWERKRGLWHCYGEPVDVEDDPFAQAKSNRSALTDLLKKPGKWSHQWFPISYALAFPDTKFSDQFDTTGLPPILTNDELDYVNDWVARAMQECSQQNYPAVLSYDMFDYTVRTLMKDYVMSLQDILDITERELITLTNQQLELDQKLQRMKKLTIQGCAGSGKTLMAIRQAKRLAHTPTVRNILLTCVNKELGNWLNKQTHSIRHRCTTKPFLEFCKDLLREHGVLTGNEVEDNEYYNELPLLMLEIIDAHNIKFDAIIVDEGQSFKTDWWVVVDQMLADKQKSYRYIFYDELQRIYDESDNKVPGEDEAINLDVNIRNTANIHHKAIKFLPKDSPLPKCNSVKGEIPWFSVYDDEGTMKYNLQKMLISLIRDGRVSAKDIVVLRGKKKTSRLIDGEKLGSFILTALENEENPTAVRFTTIQSFRGMERRVVILTEFDDEVRNIEQLNYLGASRAKTMLAYLVSNKVAPQLLTSLQEGCHLRN
jgi:hypothetical protein